ncbi:MAG: CtsR family transcriptional regulator [Peptoniphilaceae bacterium]|nr:CtsR family transcriptional regulator [Peptoniphilaceae bacterium]MDY3738605.1 CtsR family transcriptional regulator [Peptoniphilaceae bacterium]
MAGLTSDIEYFLKQLLDNSSDGVLEIGRNELANRFDCAPSQINYVLTTRFTTYKGYYVESKRGGNGFVKIITISRSKDEYIENVIKEIGKTLTESQAVEIIKDLYNKNYLDKNQAKIMKYAVSENSLTNVDIKKRNIVRKDILKNMLISVLIGG